MFWKKFRWDLRWGLEYLQKKVKHRFWKDPHPFHWEAYA